MEGEWEVLAQPPLGNNSDIDEGPFTLIYIVPNSGAFRLIKGA